MSAKSTQLESRRSLNSYLFTCPDIRAPLFKFCYTYFDQVVRESWIHVTEWPLNLNVSVFFLANARDRPVLTTLHRPRELKQDLYSPKMWMSKILISYTTGGRFVATRTGMELLKVSRPNVKQTRSPELRFVSFEWMWKKVCKY